MSFKQCWQNYLDKIKPHLLICTMHCRIQYLRRGDISAELLAFSFGTS